MKNAPDKTFKLEELAERASVSPRTVRYYVQRGLIPAPVFKGRDTVYGNDHLVRLRAIRRLQDKFLPLDAIQAEIARRSPEELRDLADGVTLAVTIPPPVVQLPTGEVRLPTLREPGSEWTRFELAPGLELHLAEDASPRTRVLADELRQFLETRRQANGGS